MDSFRSVRQSPALALFVLCLGIGSPATAQVPASGWTSLDIGAALPGSTGSAVDGFSVRGAGGDIWYQSDEFRYVYRPLSGNGMILARVARLSGTDGWRKAGLMIRETLSPGSKHASIFVTGTQGLAFQYRGATNDWSAHTASVAGAAGAWIKIERQGSTITGSYSSDAVTWTRLGQITLSMNTSAYVGLAVTGHQAQAHATADFTNVYETESSAWNSTDIGAVSYAGAAAVSNGSTHLRATGADVWGGADEFRFAYQTLAGDGTIVARLADFGATDAWSKAGVMIRETLNANAKHAFLLLSGTQGLAFQRRDATGGGTAHTGGGPGASPVWLRLERRGSTITASSSGNGTSWTPVGSATISMAGTVYAGVALASHTPWAYATAEFSNVSISGSTGGGGTPAPEPSGWTSADIGSPALGGSTFAVEGGMALTAGGSDIWGASDQFRFAYQQMTGDGSIVALVRNLTFADPWTKAGVMIRNSLTAGSAHAFMFLSGTQGSAFQRRLTTGGPTLGTAGPATGIPLWVRLQRQGSTITGSYSWDGVNWANAGSDTIAMGGTVYVGFALTSHSALPSTAYFTNASIGSAGSGGGSPAPGNQPPMVSLTSPASGATFTAPATLNLAATASDPDGSIAVVEFYSGSVLLGSDSSSPYTLTVSNVPANNYSLTAVARDNGGAMTVSSERLVSVGTAGSQTRYAFFTPSANESTTVVHYVLNIFPAGTNPATANPVASQDLGVPPLVNGERRADIGALVSGLPPGSYIATVTAVGASGTTPSAASPQFSR